MLAEQAAALVADYAQLFAVAVAAIGLVFLLEQLRRQAAQRHSERLLDLYRDLDTAEMRSKRRRVLTFGGRRRADLEQSDDEAIREVLAAMDRMAYQVLRGFADRRAAYDLYGRVIVRTIASARTFLDDERAWRGDPPGLGYCRFAERLAAEFAKEDIQYIGEWSDDLARLEPLDLIVRADALMYPPAAA